MCELLVSRGFELRSEQSAKVEHLRKICTRLFKNQTPPKPPPLSLSDFMYQQSIVLRFQNLWFHYREEATRDKMLEAASNDPFLQPQTGASHVDGSKDNYANYRQNFEHHYTRQTARGPGADPNEYLTEDEKSSGLDAHLDEPWVTPTVSYADKFLNRMHPRMGGRRGNVFPLKTTTGRHCTQGGCGEQLDLFEEGQVSELTQFGSGVVLYFKFMKWAYWTFFCLTIIYMPMMIINSFGVGIADPSGLSILALTTLGNLGDATNITAVKLPGCSSYNYVATAFFESDSDCELKKAQLGVFYSFLDCFAMFFVLCAIMWLREFEDLEVEELDKNTVTPDDFTIYIPWVPPHVEEEELIEYFSKDSRRVLVVHLAYDNGQLIDKFVDRGKLQFQHFQLGQQIRYWRTRSRLESGMIELPEASWLSCCEKGYTDKKDRELLQEREDLMQDIRILETQSEDISNPAYKRTLCAFVSFNTEEDMHETLKEFRFSMFRQAMFKLCGPVCEDETLLFRGKYLLRAKPAPSPSTIIWEHMAYGAWTRFRRRWINNLMAIIGIFVSLLVSAYALRAQKVTYALAEPAVCPLEFAEWSTARQIETIEADVAYTHCYCSLYDWSEQASDKYCKGYWKDTVISLAFQLFAIMFQVGTNMLLQMLINKRAKLEKHHSLDGFENSVFVRLFFLKFICNGLLYLIINTELVAAFVGDVGFSADFSTAWYSDVAPLIISLSLGLAPSAEGATLMRYYGYLYSLWCCPCLPKKMMSKNISKIRKEDTSGRGGVQDIHASKKTDGIFSQDDLNAKFLGPEFHLALRYANALVLFYVALAFGPAIPILIPIACFSFYLIYWCVLKYTGSFCHANLHVCSNTARLA